MEMKVFSADWCVKCKELKRKLTSMGLEYEVIDFDTNPEIFEANQVSHGIPVVIIYNNDKEVNRYVSFNNKVYDEIKELMGK